MVFQWSLPEWCVEKKRQNEPCQVEKKEIRKKVKKIGNGRKKQGERERERRKFTGNQL